MDWLNQFLFGFYPYLCMIAFFLGSWARFDRSQFSWRSQSSEFLNKDQLIWASNLFHIGILGLFAGHFVGLLAPPIIERTIGLSDKQHQWLAIVAGAIFAAVAAVGGAGLIWRRLFNPRIRRTSKPTDIFILLFICAQLLLGMIGIPHSIANINGTTMAILAQWCRSIITFQAASASLLTGVPWVYKLHLVAGMTLFLLVPFTRLVHVWSAPVGYPARRGWQIVRRNANISKGGV